MHARSSLTGNVVRAIQADKYRDSGKGISGNVQPHALHQIIAEHYKCLDADFCERISTRSWHEDRKTRMRHCAVFLSAECGLHLRMAEVKLVHPVWYRRSGFLSSF